MLLLEGMAFSQESHASFSRFSHKDGLSDNWVFSVLQDDRGFLWIGTWDGLNQFDGKDFKTYLHDDLDPNTPVGREIKCLHPDKTGQVWIGTENGLCLLNPLTDRFMPVSFDTLSQRQIAFQRIQSISEDPDGERIWAGGNGLFIPESRSRKIVPAPGPLNDSLFYRTNQVINHILPDGNRLWLATSIGILIYYPGSGRWEKVSWVGGQERLPGLDYITSLFLDADGVLWATSWGAGLIRTDTASKAATAYFLPEPSKQDASHNILNGIAIMGLHTKDNLLWISGISGGLLTFDKNTGQFRYYGSKDPKDRGKVYHEGYSVYYGETSGLWVATRMGLYRFDPQQRQLMECSPVPPDLKQTDGSYYFNQVYADPAAPMGNVLLLTTNNKGLIRYDLSTTESTKINAVFGDLLPADIFISNIYRDGEGILWIATLLKGLIRYDPNTGESRQIEFALPASDTVHWINECIEDPLNADLIWVATDAGLFRYDKSSDESRPIDAGKDETGPGNLSVHTVKALPGGVIYFLGYDKTDKAEFIARLEPGSSDANVILGPFPESDSGFIHMTDLAIGTGAEIFIASYHGLYFFDATMPKPALQRFNPGGQGIRSRLDHLVQDNSDNIWALSSGDIYMLDVRTRQLYRFSFESLDNDSKLNLNYNPITGDIILGSWQKIYILKADSSLRSDKPLAKYITGIRISGAHYQGMPESLTNSKIVLPFRDNSVTIEYTAINYRTGAMQQYAYRMQGLERDWNITGNKSVSYKLPPGKYRFELRSSNESGLWEDSVVYTDIVIRPPVYRTWWFALISLVLLSAIVYSAYRYRINQLLKLQKMRDNISRDLHDDIGSALTNIAIMNEMAREETRRGGDTEKILGKSAEDIHAVISSLSDIVWNVNPEYDDLKFLLARMRRYALDLLENTEMQYTIDIREPDEKISMNMEQRRDFYLIFKEGLNNLVKYAGGTHAWISIGLERNAIQMIIADDGKGFAPEAVAYGNGLKNMRNRTEAWDGTFSIASKLGKGTELKFIIPISN